MKKFVLNHKILISTLVILFVLIICFAISVKHLDIPKNNIKAIWVGNSSLGSPLYFTDKSVIDEAVDMFNGYMLKDSSMSELKGGISCTSAVIFYYENGDEKSYGIYNEGIIQELYKKSSGNNKSSTIKWYKKYGGSFLSDKVDDFFWKRKHLSTPDPMP